MKNLQAKQKTKALLEFLQKSPTAYHAVENTAKILADAGFSRLFEGEDWKLEAGKGYFLTKNQSTILAFRVPKKTPRQMLICASHTDSPTFKLKENFETVAFDTYRKLDTEPYGGGIFASWLDRPLSVAGRLVILKDGVLEAKIVSLDRDLALIPSVAIHQNREVNKGVALNPAIDLQPVIGDGKGGKEVLLELLSQAAGCKPDAIRGADLFLYNRAPGSIWGGDEEFFSSPRIDNLMCAYGTLQGFLKAKAPLDSLGVYASFDNEEVGSNTKQGAGSVFFRNALERVAKALGVDFYKLMANGFLMSADNAHAIHPNHPELYDSLNVPKLGGGLVIKTNASQRYATDGLSAALMEEICKHAGLPVQRFANRSDQPGGSTLGSIADTHLPILTVDVGMAQLAMHSSYESASCEDIGYLESSAKAFYETGIRAEQDGKIRIVFE